MLKSLLLFSFCCLATFCLAQTKPVYNLDFENIDATTGMPAGWGFGNISNAGLPEDGSKANFKLDQNVKQNGKYSVLIDWTDGPKEWTATNYVINRVFKGKRIKLTGYLKTEDVSGWAGLWMRIDGGDHKALQFDNMQNRAVKGTTKWKQYSISLDYDPQLAKSIVVGGLIVGKGKLWMDNFQISIDSVDIEAADTLKQVTLEPVTISAPAVTPVYRGSAPRAWEIKNTRIALQFNMNEKTADAKEWIKMHPYFYAVDTLTLDAKGMRIDSVELVGRKGNTRLDYTYEKDLLNIRFGKKYEMKDSIELYLKYTAMPYASPSGGSGAILDDKGLYFINTDLKTPHKPVQIWTQGETESNSHWMITVDKPNTRFTTQIELTIPDSFVTLSNGALVKQVKGNKGMRTDIWKMDLPIQAYAVMIAAGKFSIVKDHWKNKEVNYYVEPEYAPYARLMFNHTPEMIEYFSQRTGVQYPWNKYSQIVVRDYVSGAMENTSATLLGEMLNQNAREIADYNLEDIVSHELFHQWFGDYVTCESWSNITVNESFANYGEQLWRGHYYGKAAGDELAFNDLQGYIGGSSYSDPQLVRFNYDSREEVFDHISYNKGGAILHYLNSLIGDASFDRAMYLYLSKNALHSGEAHQWRLAVEEATGQDWNWFFNEWYFHAGHPVLKVAYNYNDSLQKLIVTVNQTQTDSTYLYQLPLKTALIYGNEKTVIDWNITKKKDTFIYAYKGGLKPVVVPDIDRVMPGELKDGKKPEQWLEAYKASTNYITKHLAISAAGKSVTDSVSQLILEMGIKDSLKSIRRQAMSTIGGAQNDKFRKKWTPRVMEMAVSDSSKGVRASALDALGKWKVSAAKPIMLGSLYDSSYAVAGNALESLNKLDKDTAYIMAKLLHATNPKSNLETTIWSIIGKKGEDADIVIFENDGQYVSGNKKFSFGPALSSYMKTVKSDASYKKGLDLITGLAITENMKYARTALNGNLLQVLSDEIDNSKSDKTEESEPAKRRIDITKAALQKIIDAETDPETKKDFEKKLKEAFE